MRHEEKQSEVEKRVAVIIAALGGDLIANLHGKICAGIGASIGKSSLSEAENQSMIAIQEQADPTRSGRAVMAKRLLQDGVATDYNGAQDVIDGTYLKIMEAVTKVARAEVATGTRYADEELGDVTLRQVMEMIPSPTVTHHTNSWAH